MGSKGNITKYNTAKLKIDPVMWLQVKKRKRMWASFRGLYYIDVIGEERGTEGMEERTPQWGEL